MPSIVRPARRYAEWTPGYAGAPPFVGGYYLVFVLSLVFAAFLEYALKFAGLATFFSQLAGPAVRLYNPVVRRRVHPLRDLPAAAPQYAVRFTLGREWTYATDEGLASFVDGWLVVQGAGCAFSVRATDVSIQRSEQALGFPGPAETHTLTFNFSERGFKEAWDDWRNAKALEDGVPVFPPVRPLAARGDWDHALVAGILSVAAFALPFHGPAAWPWLLGIMTLIVALHRRTKSLVSQAHFRMVQGKPPRRSAWKILGAEVHLGRLGEAYRTDRRRRRRRRALARR